MPPCKEVRHFRETGTARKILTTIQERVTRELNVDAFRSKTGLREGSEISGELWDEN
jgi:hypothetical protein